MYKVICEIRANQTTKSFEYRIVREFDGELQGVSCDWQCGGPIRLDAMNQARSRFTFDDFRMAK